MIWLQKAILLLNLRPPHGLNKLSLWTSLVKLLVKSADLKQYASEVHFQNMTKESITCLVTDW